MMKALIFLIVSIFLSSCQKKTVVETCELSVYDSISITIDFPMLTNYIKLVPYCNGDSIYVTGYNHYEHSIDFINLVDGENFIIPFKREGPNGVLPIQDYCFVNDKIVCKDESGILTLGMDGSVIERVPIKELISPAEKYSVRPLGFSLSNYQYLNSYDSKVFIPLSPIKKGDAVHIGKIYDVSQNLLEVLPPCYPSEVVNLTQYLGGFSIPDINMFSMDKLVYNFPFSSKVYLYEIKSEMTEVLDVRSNTIENEMDFEQWKGMNVVTKAKHELSRSRFGRIYYSTSMKKFFRIHLATKEENRGKLRKIYLMIFDEKGNSSKEYLLPSQFSEQYYFLNDTLYFACRSNNETSFNVARISLEQL